MEILHILDHSIPLFSGSVPRTSSIYSDYKYGGMQFKQ
jgi:hypothetical protein